MLVRYDLHVHSALSPCADDDMTPANIVGYAALEGIQIVAIADHNAIGNVKVAMEVGEAYGVCVVPAMELQTQEDIHVLCLFPTFEALQGFFDAIDFPSIKNKPSVFGNQLIVDEDDNVVATEERLLHVGANIAVERVPSLAESFGGIAVAAHVDREENGMVEILGDVVEEYGTIELSSHATQAHYDRFSAKKIICNSDAHWLDAIGKAGATMTLDELSAQGVLEAIR